ncbi:mltA-interacting protein, partial [Yersinia pestis PY-59]|jgi:hypothetical protein
MRE